VGFWIGFAASCVLLMADVVFLATDYSDRTFSFITFGLILAGVLIEVVELLKDWCILPLFKAVCFGVAFSFHMYQGLPTLSDIMNGVNFIGGKPMAVVVFGVIFLLGTIAAVVSCFSEQRKEIVVFET
jgi:hypothetical protein